MDTEHETGIEGRTSPFCTHISIPTVHHCPPGHTGKHTPNTREARDSKPVMVSTTSAKTRRNTQPPSKTIRRYSTEPSRIPPTHASHVSRGRPAGDEQQHIPSALPENPVRSAPVPKLARTDHPHPPGTLPPTHHDITQRKHEPCHPQAATLRHNPPHFRTLPPTRGSDAPHDSPPF